jgi:hypothetical protein
MKVELVPPSTSQLPPKNNAIYIYEKGEGDISFQVHYYPKSIVGKAGIFIKNARNGDVLPTKQIKLYEHIPIVLVG